MGLFSALLSGAALLALENAQRKAEERTQRQAAQQQPPPRDLTGLWQPYYVSNPYQGVVNPLWPPQPGPPVQPHDNIFKPNMGVANPWSPFQPDSPARPQHNTFEPVQGVTNSWQPFQPNVPNRARDNAQAAAAADEAVRAQAEEVRKTQERLERFRQQVEQDLKKAAEENQRAEAQKEHERREAQDKENQRKARGQEEQRRRESQAKARRGSEAKARREASARTENMRKKRRWEEYESAWERFNSISSEEARSLSVRQLIPWPTASGHFPDTLDEENIRNFFVTGASGCPGSPRDTFREQRNRWHPDRLRSQRLAQLRKDVDAETERAITVITQILNGLVCTEGR